MEEIDLDLNRQIYQSVHSEFKKRRKGFLPLLVLCLIFSIIFFVLRNPVAGFFLLLATLLLLRFWLKRENPKVAVVTGIISDKRESPHEEPNFRLELLLEKAELINK